MTLEMGDTDKTYKNIAECRERGIRILPPDVNESREDFTVCAQPTTAGMRPIRFGLGAVRGVGSKAIEAILAARDKDGPFEPRLLQARARCPPGREWRREPARPPWARRSSKPDQVRRLRFARRQPAPAPRRRSTRPSRGRASHAKAEDTQQIGLFARQGIAVEAPEPPLPRRRRRGRTRNA